MTEPRKGSQINQCLGWLLMYLVRNPTKGGYIRGYREALVGGGFYPKKHEFPAQTDKRVKGCDLFAIRLIFN